MKQAILDALTDYASQLQADADEQLASIAYHKQQIENCNAEAAQLQADLKLVSDIKKHLIVVMEGQGE